MAPMRMTLAGSETLSCTPPSPCSGCVTTTRPESVSETFSGWADRVGWAGWSDIPGSSPVSGTGSHKRNEHLGRGERSMARTKLHVAHISGVEEGDGFVGRQHDVAQTRGGVGRQGATEPALGDRLPARADPGLVGV